ncbi:MAG TPA: choice-of-anchor P family protein [Actinomycetota bacterium]
MRHTRSFRWSVFAAAVVGAGLLAWPAAGAAQTVVGDAKAVQATTFGLIGGTTTVLADTGWLSGPSDVLDASLITGDVPSLLSGEVLDAVTIGWPDQVVSQANLASLGLSVAGIPISADFVMATTTAPLGAAATGSSLIENLSINGVPIDVTGEPNQTISIPGGQVVLNEQTASPSGTTVNALHAVVSGVADVVVASATAGIQ